MLTFAPGATGDKLAAKQDAGTDVVFEVCGDLRTISGSTDAYGSLAQGALSTTPTALIGPAAGTDMLVSNVSVFNTGASTRVVTFYKTKNSTTYDTTTQWAVLTLLAGERAEWNDGWEIYSAQGIIKNAAVTAGLIVGVGSTAAQTGFAADTYLAGSALALPTGLIRAGTSLYWVFDVVKTAAGTAAPKVIIRFGINGSGSDVARVTFTFSIQTAAIDRGIIEVWANFSFAGSVATLAGIAKLSHQLAVTGLNTVQPAGMQTLAVTSGGFDSTVPSSFIGLSVNGGASAAWTVTAVQASAYM